MGFRIRGSHIIALLIAGGLAAWMATGDVSVGGENAEGNGTPAIAEREATDGDGLFKVRYVPLRAEARSQSILVRGRTRADAVVPVRAETEGILEQRLVNKGDLVSPGDLVCVIEGGAREADLARARAQLAQAETEYNANAQLNEKGFASQNRLTALRAALDAARAGLAAAELELERTQIRAAASGIVQDPVAEVGDVLSKGGACVTLIDTDPMLFTGQVSERDIDRVKTGMGAEVTLVTGETATGTLRYISPSADAQTRTFAVEIVFEPGSSVRDGMTAEARLDLPAETAFRIAPSWLTLADDGEIGVRIVGEDGMVAFAPVTIVAQEKDGFWVTGLEDGARVITLGQEYIVRGERVDALPDERFASRLAATPANDATGTSQ